MEKLIKKENWKCDECLKEQNTLYFTKDKKEICESCRAKRQTCDSASMISERNNR